MKNFVANFKKNFTDLINNEALCMMILVFDFFFVTIYGFLQNPLKSTGTASEIGLNYPNAFKIWGFLSCAMFLLNIRYMYKKGGYSSKTGYTLMILGSLSVIGTVFIPSTLIFGPQLIAHWGTALMFALLNPIAMIMYFYAKSKEGKRYLFTANFLVGIMVVTIAILVGLIIAFDTKGKNGLIESVPMWAMFVILFLENFTTFYDKDKQKVKEPALTN